MLAALHTLDALGSTPSGTTLSELLAPYERYVQSGEINTTVKDTAAAIADVRAQYEGQQGTKIDLLDGMTVNAPGWWFNLRPSNTEPLLRLNVEATTEEEMKRVRDSVLAISGGSA